MATTAEYQQFMEKTLTCLAGGDFANINFEQYEFNASQNKSINALKKLQNRFDQVIQQNQLFAKGIIRLDISKQGKVDPLYDSFDDNLLMQQTMVNTLKDVAQGNYDINVEKKHQDDQLSQALAQIIDNLKEVVSQANTVASGDYRADIKARSNQDSLGIALQLMTQSLREASDVTAAIATGDLSTKVTAKGENDLLANSINLMVDNLQNMTQQANDIAQGDYRAQVQPRSDKDELGKALFLMTQSLREASAVTEAISIGDFNQRLEAKGKNDLLANSINNMAQNLKDITRQANDIAQGDYSAEIKPLSDKDELGKALFAMTGSLRDIGSVAEALSNNNFEQKVQVKGERDLLANSINNMVDNLREMTSNAQREDWIKSGHAQLADKMRGELNLEAMADNVITFLSKYTDSQVGVFYLADEARNLTLASSYAYKRRKSLSDIIPAGEGIVGQAVKEKQLICVSNVPKDYMAVNSGLGEATPNAVLALPLVVENTVKGAIELGSFGQFSEQAFELFDRVSESIAVAINSARDRSKMQDLLEEAQRTTEELQTQQEELRSSNEELEEQTETIKRSESELKTQQEQLQASNEELEEKTQYLLKQKVEIENKNKSIEQSKLQIEEKARDLEMSSKYKSEFLANMSHELRTPLNSLLILAKMLMENKEENLTERQIDSAKIIYNGGNDLLALINDILDLSKVEAGQMTLQIDDIPLTMIENEVRGQFEPLASEQPFEFKVFIDPDLPPSFETDRQRTLQIIKNLLSNAFKFTRQGEVVFRAFKPEGHAQFKQPHLSSYNCIGFAVVDTGIGIAPQKQRSIFEAFQQADGSTSRDYGGTGLGLTISRDLCALLGGEIQVESEEGRGSTFIIYLPIKNDGKHSDRASMSMNPTTIQSNSKTNMTSLARNEPAPAANPTLQLKPTPTNDTFAQAAQASDVIPMFISDDREQIQDNSTSVLIVEDDRDFASVLTGIAHEKNYLCLAAGDGKSALQMAKRYQPSAILLDLGLPDIDGLKLLDMFKQDLSTRHIPIHVITGREVLAETLTRGAVGFLHKPTSAEELNNVFSTFDRYLTNKDKTILIIEDDDIYRNSLKGLLEHEDVAITEAINGEEGIQLINERDFDCVILDMGLPDMTGSEVLQRLSENKTKTLPPFIVNTGRDLTESEYKELNKYTEDIIVKGTDSSARLLDEVTLFLHQAEANLPSEQRKTLQMLHDDNTALEGHTVLMVDDDLRNTFALSNMLEDKGLEVIVAENGQKALDELERNPKIELVLMDIMMPVMDGYEAMEKIRAQKKFKDLPIIALTAKAMAEDKSKCLKSGANDYMNKPVDVDKLLSLIKVSIH